MAKLHAHIGKHRKRRKKRKNHRHQRHQREQGHVSEIARQRGHVVLVNAMPEEFQPRPQRARVVIGFLMNGF